jgi:hypothetical protein
MVGSVFEIGRVGNLELQLCVRELLFQLRLSSAIACGSGLRQALFDSRDFD